MIHQVFFKKWFLDLHLSENKLKFAVVNINYNNIFLKQSTSCYFKHNFCKNFKKKIFSKQTAVWWVYFFFVTSYTYTKYLNLQTRHKIVQSVISRLNKSRLFVFCNVHYFLTRLSYHLRSCLNQSLLSLLFYYTSEWVRSTSLTRQSSWFVFIHVEI